MTDEQQVEAANAEPEDVAPPKIGSLKELIDRVSGRGLAPVQLEEDSGIAEVIPFPFLGLVGQPEMKLALVLALINPAVGGVLLIGPRGTGKTTAVRSLIDLLPMIPRSLCYYGCLPEDIEAGGMDAVCPDCARKYALGEDLAVMDRVRLVELPLNAQLEDVIGRLDERAALHDRFRLRRGILSQADRNLLYVDEINLLSDEIIDAILDAAAQGRYTVRRGPVATTYRARFVLIGSMNPEEGQLRAQIQDRFGLRLLVRGLSDPDQRLDVYRRVRAYLTNPRQTAAQFAGATAAIRDEIQRARELLPQVSLPDQTAKLGLDLIQSLGIDSLRAELALFEAARAHAAADDRTEVTAEDLRGVAPMALRLRRSQFMKEYFAYQETEEDEIQSRLSDLLAPESGQDEAEPAHE